MKTMGSVKEKGSKRILRYVVLFCGSVLFGLLFLELMLHIIPLKQTASFSSVKYIGDEDLGYLPMANQDAEFNIECVQNPHVISNSFGFRGSEWGSTKSPKVALLGDSFLHALTVSDDLHIANLLQSSTGGDIWNAGVSGYGTYQELLVWRKFIKSRKPDVTVLFLYLENDIRDNHCGLCRAENQLYSPCLSLKDDAVVEQKDFEVRQPATGFKVWLVEHCYSYRLLSYLMKSEPSKPANFFDQESFAYNVYRPGLSAQWDEGWVVTAWSLRELKRECDSIGSKLLIVSVPGVIQLATDFNAELQSQTGSGELPEDFDLDFPIEQLRAIADSANIPLLDMQPAFIAYRDQYQLKSPVFGWCCDGHWNPLGHRLSADLVHNFMVESKWIQGEKRITPTPVEVLGPSMMEKIYSCGTVHMD